MRKSLRRHKTRRHRKSHKKMCRCKSHTRKHRRGRSSYGG